jgi:hypothetical protein
MLITQTPILSMPAEAQGTGNRQHNLYSISSGVLRALLIITLVGVASFAGAQALPTASRVGELQVGGLFANANSDYSRSRFNGYGVYADMDFHHGLGVEAVYHFISDQDPNTNVYERTYEIGARYSRHYGRFQPYAKVLVGRGVFNYPENTANFAYNLGALGGGTDIRVRRHIYGRVDFEYQKWFGFAKNFDSTPNDSISPTILSGGFAYRF